MLSTDERGLRGFDLNLLRVFAALMRERSVTRAGEALFLSQPATSAALARLRGFFGDELFVRNGRLLEPTPRAEALAEQLGPAMQTVIGAIAGAVPFDPATDSRVFRIGMSEDIVMAMLPYLPRMAEEAPNCRISIRAASYRTIPRLLESREVSVAVGYTTDLPAATKLRVLYRSGWRVLRDPGSPGPVDLDAYCARPHLLVTPRGDLSGIVDEALARMGRTRRVLMGVPDYGLLHRLIVNSNLLCTVSEAVVEAIEASGALPRLAADPTPFELGEAMTHMVWRVATDQDPGEAWLRAQLVRYLARR